MKDVIAKIIPIQRLPRQLGHFDYIVPEELVDKVEVGQLVTIPFRKSNIFGLILTISTIDNLQLTVDKALKSIVSLVSDVPFLNKSQLDLLQELSEIYGVSVGTIAKMMLPPMQKRKLGNVGLRTSDPPLRRACFGLQNVEDEKPIYHFYTSQEKHVKALRGAVGDTTLILVPEAYLLDEVRQLLPIEIQQNTVVWHSGLSVKQKFERWFQVRNGEKSIVIGTRGAVFLPFQDLKNIVVDYEHKSNHKHWDQAPRFHVKDLVGFFSNTYCAQVHLMSFSPSSESYFGVYKGGYILIQPTPLPPPLKGKGGIVDEVIKKSPSLFKGGVGVGCRSLPTLVNMKNERKGKNFDFFSNALSEAIAEATGDIFLFINRKGYATSLRCEDCDSVASCRQCGLPLIYRQKKQTLHCHYCKTVENFERLSKCASCSGSMTKLMGKGMDFVLEEVKKILGERADEFDIETVTSETDEIGTAVLKRPRILIGTEAAFRYVRWEKTGIIGFLSIDAQLAIPEFLAGEHVWHLINEVNFRRTEVSTFFVQTFQPQHLVFRSLAEPDRFYRTDLNSRRALLYPPYSYIVRYFYGNRDIRIARGGVERIHLELQKNTKESSKKIKISSPIEMHPRFYRNKFWFELIVKLETENWQDDLKWLNKFIPNNWKIDPNPISLLSP